jgi:hypothetical protein
MAKIVRVYTILPGAVAADNTFSSFAPFPVARMEIAAANPEWIGAQAYQIRGWVIDIGAGVAAAIEPINGMLQDSIWNTQNSTIEFVLPSSITGAAAAGGFVQVKGWVRTGAQGPGADVDFRSTEFVWA